MDSGSLVVVILASIGAVSGVGAGIWSLINMWITERVRTGNQTAIEEVKAAYQHGIEEAKAEYQQDLERLKASLGLETESLRAQLARVAFEHQTRFSRLHERRVDVIAEMYRRLVNAEVAFSRAMTPVRWGTQEETTRQEQEDKKEAATAGNAFQEYFRENRLWLDDDLSANIENLAKQLRAAWLQYTTRDRRRDPGEAWDSAWRQVTEDVPKIRAEIEAAMRVMLTGPELASAEQSH